MPLSKKTSFFQVLVLALVFFVSYSFHMSNRAVVDDNDVTPYICQSKDRINRPCAQYVVAGCICYTDGTCSNEHVNTCTDCADSDVYSVLEGAQCPTQ